MLELKYVYKKFNLEAGFFARERKYVYAINGVSLKIGENETYGLVGESGCGKTTLARLIVGMYPFDEGEILFTGKDGRLLVTAGLSKNDLKVLRGKIKYIFQDPARSLNPRMSTLEVLTAGYRYSPQWPGPKKAREEAQKILLDVGLKPTDLDRRPADFSGGQRQRISIARALIMKPELLICDEVVSSLDVSIQAQILSLLIKLKDEYRLSLLFIAHDLAVVSYVCDRVGVMYRGMLMEEAPAGELIQHRLHPYTRHLYASIPQLGRSRQQQERETFDFSEIPDPTVKPAGCSFYEECPEAGPDCAEERPDLKEVRKNHFVSCQFV